MHEFSLASSVINYIEDLSRKMGLKKITSIHIELGEMTHINPSQFRFCFKVLSKGTIGENSRLYIRKRKPIFICKNCKRRIKKDVNEIIAFQMKCPYCKGKIELERGKELVIKKIKGIR
ncbi:MAG: hydrogenase maturation nickel metallochaperone HypA [Candidatus Methanomethylicota archaeon]|jgi:hydrogenase nickel incorporation protein HypA/HybF|uniref:Hydrogenase maturation factor HypA n=1 Tax=Thermoproteota archaeon TaxID=2056631 RepID=A0A523BF65_9CREN|nr:MAG: hydrogenase maturation nickel metallochaperone HypA [Candidatus Verstraetearchaeota archaeon]TDA39462.1 MAG: hydrogenase maturation nickel metallochaperone HypA [Candidatus Verstraetearchaeota archaeon]